MNRLAQSWLEEAAQPFQAYRAKRSMSKTRRTVKNSKKTGAVSRSKALAAAKTVKARRAGNDEAALRVYESAPYLVKK